VPDTCEQGGRAALLGALCCGARGASGTEGAGGVCGPPRDVRRGRVGRCCLARLRGGRRVLLAPAPEGRGFDRPVGRGLPGRSRRGVAGSGAPSSRVCAASAAMSAATAIRGTSRPAQRASTVLYRLLLCDQELATGAGDALAGAGRDEDTGRPCPAGRMLILTALRLGEDVDARRPEGECAGAVDPGSGCHRHREARTATLAPRTSAGHHARRDGGLRPVPFRQSPRRIAVALSLTFGWERESRALADCRRSSKASAAAAQQACSLLHECRRCVPGACRRRRVAQRVCDPDSVVRLRRGTRPENPRRCAAGTRSDAGSRSGACPRQRRRGAIEFHATRHSSSSGGSASASRPRGSASSFRVGRTAPSSLSGHSPAARRSAR
jgi:hypothetical protein